MAVALCHSAPRSQLPMVLANSLLFDFDEPSEDLRPSRLEAGAAVCGKSNEVIAQLKERLEFFTQPNNDFAAKLLRDVRYHWDGDVVELASTLANFGYSVVVRTALGGGSACFRNLRNEFLQVRGDGDYDGCEFIVEPRFREAFEIHLPTPAYTQLLASVPEVYCGPSARLVPVVQVLCGEMQDSFSAQGLTIPPWRKTQSMLSKWLPARMRDTSFTRSSSQQDADAGPRAAHNLRGPAVTPLLRPHSSDHGFVPFNGQQPRSPTMLPTPIPMLNGGTELDLPSPFQLDLPALPSGLSPDTKYKKNQDRLRSDSTSALAVAAPAAGTAVAGRSPTRGLLSAQLSAAALLPPSDSTTATGAAVVNKQPSALDAKLPVIHKVKYANTNTTTTSKVQQLRDVTAAAAAAVMAAHAPLINI